MEVTHRKSDRLYHVWQGMKERCSINANTINSKWYSDKGISVCNEWKDDFLCFRKWAIDNGYDYTKNRKEQSLDRIDNSKGYSPDNCRFVTHSENCKNTSRNIWITSNGKTLCLNDWSKELGISLETLRKRYIKGLSVEEILYSPKFATHKSNTGVKGISLIKKTGQYIVRDNHKYLGVAHSLEDAILIKERYINGRIYSK